MKTKIVRPIWNQNKHVSFWNTKSPIEGASTSILHMNPERSSLPRRVFSQRCSGGDTHQNWRVTAGVFQLQQAYQDSLLEWLPGMKGGRQGGRACESQHLAWCTSLSPGWSTGRGLSPRHPDSQGLVPEDWPQGEGSRGATAEGLGLPRAGMLSEACVAFCCVSSQSCWGCWTLGERTPELANDDVKGVDG